MDEMSDDNVMIRIKPDGMVQHVQEVILKTTTMSGFYSEMQNIGTATLCSPILPRGAICHARKNDGDQLHEYITMFFASQKVTISYRSMQDTVTEENVKTYTIAMPHLLLRQHFINGRISDMQSGVIKKIPEHMQDSVFLLQMPNIFEDGKVCIPLQGTPGDIVRTCQANIDLFFGQAPFSNDLIVWPPGISGFEDWQIKTDMNSRFILETEWKYLCKLDSFVKGQIRDE